MIIRLGESADLATILEIVEKVIPLMQSSGNFQWDDAYPLEGNFATDVVKRQLWVAEDGDSGKVAGFAALTTDQPVEYAEAGLIHIVKIIKIMSK
jgi:hypothetical protein